MSLKPAGKLSYTVYLACFFVTMASVAFAQDFSLTPSAASVSVQQGSDASSLTFTTAISGGFNSAIGLTATGYPAGITVSFDTISAPGSGTSTMKVKAEANAPTGDYHLKVFAAAVGVTHSTDITLTVNLSPASFAISILPKSRSIMQGDKASVAITVSSTGGNFSGDVSLSPTGMPTNTKVTFDSDTVTVAPGTPGTTIMTVNVGPSDDVKDYKLTITGLNGALKSTASLPLTVTVGQLSTSSGGCSGCILQLGVGLNINNKNPSDYINSGNLLQTTHLGNTSPQYLVGIAYQLPWRGLPYLLKWQTSCSAATELVQRGTSKADLDDWMVYCYPFRLFVNLKFTSDASQNFSGFTVGFSHRLQKYVDLLLGVSFAPFNQPTPGFQRVAIQTTIAQQAKNNPYYTAFSPYAMQKNLNDAYDGFPTILINPDGTQGPPIYNGAPLASHTVFGGFVGIALPINFCSFTGGCGKH